MFPAKSKSGLQRAVQTGKIAPNKKGNRKEYPQQKDILTYNQRFASPLRMMKSL